MLSGLLMHKEINMPLIYNKIQVLVFLLSLQSVLFDYPLAFSKNLDHCLYFSIPHLLLVLRLGFFCFIHLHLFLFDHDLRLIYLIIFHNYFLNHLVFYFLSFHRFFRFLCYSHPNLEKILNAYISLVIVI